MVKETQTKQFEYILDLYEHFEDSQPWCRQLIQLLNLYTYWTIKGRQEISTKHSKGAANQKRLRNAEILAKH